MSTVLSPYIVIEQNVMRSVQFHTHFLSPSPPHLIRHACTIICAYKYIHIHSEEQSLKVLKLLTRQ